MLGKQESTDEHDDAAASIVSGLVHVRGRSSGARAGVGLLTSLWLAQDTDSYVCSDDSLSGGTDEFAECLQHEPRAGARGQSVLGS